MKIRIILALFATYLLANLNFLYAQDGKLDEYSWEQEPIQTESATYFGIGGGYTMTFHFIDFAAINNHLKANNFGLSDFDGQLLLSGGEGYTGVVFVQNLNVGFFSYGGNKEVSKDTIINTTNVKRAVQFSTGFTGLTIDYGIVPFGSFAIKPGISLGWGNMSVENYQAVNSFNWADYKPTSDALNYINRAETSFLFVKPGVSFEYKLAKFLMLRANVSYAMTFSYDWKYNNVASLKDMPTDINSNALQFQLGVFVGLFNF